MAMAGLGGGHPDVIWRWPFHMYVAVRRAYLAILNPQPEKAESDVTEIAPGITVERISRREDGSIVQGD